MRATGAVIIAAALATSASPAVAGPPYATDDPEPTGLGHWEIYAFATRIQFRGRFEGSAGLDLNYGAAKDVQLTATLPIDFEGGGGTHAGAGDIEIGIKYRLFHNDPAGFSVAAFPRLILPTAGRRFGSGRVALLLPVWVQKDLGPWSLFGGGGYAINPGPGNSDFWQSGLALTRTISPRLSLGSEITHQSADGIGARSTTGLGFGGIYRLGGAFSILFSGGPTLQHPRDGGRYRAYTALALNF